MAAKMQQPKLGRPPTINYPGWKTPIQISSDSTRAKAMRAWKESPNQPWNWKPAGNPIKVEANWTKEELDSICSNAMLRYMGASKMQERAENISLQYGKEMSTKSLTALYKARSINYAVVRKRLGGANPAPAEQ